jgi:hypothetical protein
MAYATPIDSQNIAIQKLERRGFTRTQAEGIVEILTDATTGELATKYDIAQLEIRLYKYLGGILIAHAAGTAALTVALLQLLR